MFWLAANISLVALPWAFPFCDLRIRPEFCMIYDADTRDCMIRITLASLHVRKWRLRKMFTWLLRLPWRRCRPYIGTPKFCQKLFSWPSPTAVAAATMKNFSIENLFEDLLSPWKPIRHSLEASARTLFTSRNSTEIHSIIVYCKGYPILLTLRRPLITDNHKKLYLISLEALDFSNHGNRIPFSEFHNRLHITIYTELTNVSLSFELRFSAELTENTESSFSAKNCYQFIPTLPA